jgi:predicted alpha/beta hydrolase family esterase
VPGRGAPRPEHWLQRWADAHPEYRWAPFPPGPPFILEDRVAALDETVRSDGMPAVLIAHSAGCLAVATWATRHAGPVHAALLVTPAYPDPDIATGPLPFRTIVVASRTDPYTSYEQFERYAGTWGAELFDAGDAGHLDTSSGYGPWPDGERLLASLRNREGRAHHPGAPAQ